MNDSEWFERRLKADRLRREAADDRRRAEECDADDDMFAESLERRAQHKLYLANEEDGGYGQ